MGEGGRERRGRKRSPASITATVTGDGDRMRSGGGGGGGGAVARIYLVGYTNTIRQRCMVNVDAVSVPIIREQINRQVLHSSAPSDMGRRSI